MRLDGGARGRGSRGPYGPWLCLLVAFALDIVRGQREGQGGARGSRAQTEAGDGDAREPGVYEF